MQLLEVPFWEEILVEYMQRLDMRGRGRVYLISESSDNAKLMGSTNFDLKGVKRNISQQFFCSWRNSLHKGPVNLPLLYKFVYNVE